MMDFSACSQDGNVNLYFVSPVDGNVSDCSTPLVCAFQACKEHDLMPVWITESECIKLSPTKQDVFICDPFEGAAFEHLISGAFKCVVLGPMCLLSCLHSKKPVPGLPSPLHNTAMQEIVVTSTGFDKEEKQELQKLIERMCGIYSSNFHEGVTHLVAKLVGSKKYMVAVEKNIPIMTGKWVESVWQAAAIDSFENVVATAEEFIRHTCPPLLGLVICVSQLPRKEKETLKKIIEDCGGIYSGNLEMSVTSVLVSSNSEGDKFKHANNWRIPCVTPAWIYDSIEVGRALPTEEYKVKKKMKSSTPTHDNTVRAPPDMSLCSTIMNDSCLNGVSHVNETLQTEASFSLRGNDVDSPSNDDALDYEKAIEADAFLDGCKLFIMAAESPMLNKLNKVIGVSGAVVYGTLNESVSHVVVVRGFPKIDMSVMDSWATKPVLVTLDWVTASMKLKKPADELLYLYKEDDKYSFPQQIRNRIPSETIKHDLLIKQYCQTIERSVNEEVPASQDMGRVGIFLGKIFRLSGYDQENIDELTFDIESQGGLVLENSNGEIADFVVHNFKPSLHTDIEGKEHISHLYIQDCLESETLLPVEYYHLCFGWPENLQPLNGCVITTSIYQNRERIFLVHIIQLLGGSFQEILAKKEAPARNVKSSTHLVCPLPEGDKYRGASKWKLPVVTKDWILKCIEDRSRAAESQFGIGSSPCVNPANVIRQNYEYLKSLSMSDADMETQSSQHDDSALIVATPAVNRKLKAIRDQHANEAATIQTPDVETVRKLYPTPGETTKKSNLNTPETPYGSTWHVAPNKFVRKGFKRALDALPDDNVSSKRAYIEPSTPDDSYVKKLFNNLANVAHSEPDCEDACDDVEKTNADLIAADDAGALSGVKVYATKKLSDIQQDLYQAVIELGGDYVWTYSDEVTHLIHVGRLHDTNKEFRLARDQGKQIVSPDWVWMCRDEKRRVDEKLFPHVHNPKMSLSIVNTRSQRPSKSRTKLDANLSGAASNLTINESDEKSPVADNGEPNVDDDIRKKLEEAQALSVIVAAKPRPSIGRIKSIAETVDVSPRNQIHANVKLVTDSEIESIGTAFTWDDPADRATRERLRIGNAENTEDLLANASDITENINHSMNDSTNAGKEEGETLYTQYVFTLSGMTDEQRQTYYSLIAFLGGQMSDNQTNFDPEATHVITMKPSRSEKHLASIACGKWILYKSFLDASHNAGKFVDETLHEWGNPEAIALPLSHLKPAEIKLANSAYQWRCKLKGTGRGAFSDMKAVIYSSAERTTSFSRLIVAGGGEVVPLREFEEEDLVGITHCFVELSKYPKVDLAVFASHGIPCLLPIYLNSFLTSDVPPDTMDECIPEYQRIVHNMTPMIAKPQTRSSDGKKSTS